MHHGRANGVAAQALEAITIAFLNADGRVQGEAVDVGAESAAREVGGSLCVLRDARIDVPGTWSERGLALDRGRAHGVEQGRIAVVRCFVAVRELATVGPPLSAARGRGDVPRREHILAVPCMQSTARGGLAHGQQAMAGPGLRPRTCRRIGGS
jgi:hypothetical protein